MKTFINARHGDNFLKKVESFPSNLKELNTKTIAVGEVTGRHHTFKGVGVKVMEDPSTKKKYIEITNPTPLTHQEHKTIVIDPGKYEVVQEREFDYMENELQKVVD